MPQTKAGRKLKKLQRIARRDKIVLLNITKVLASHGIEVQDPSKIPGILRGIFKAYKVAPAHPELDPQVDDALERTEGASALEQRNLKSIHDLMLVTEEEEEPADAFSSGDDELVVGTLPLSIHTATPAPAPGMPASMMPADPATAQPPAQPPGPIPQLIDMEATTKRAIENTQRRLSDVYEAPPPSGKMSLVESRKMMDEYLKSQGKPGYVPPFEGAAPPPISGQLQQPQPPQPPQQQQPQQRPQQQPQQQPQQRPLPADPDEPSFGDL